MNIKPLHDRILAIRVDAEEKTRGGIIIPDTAKEQPQEGIVVAAGTGKRDDSGKLIPMAVKKDDRILFGRYAGADIKINGIKHLILKEDDILGILMK